MPNTIGESQPGQKMTPGDRAVSPRAPRWLRHDVGVDPTEKPWARRLVRERQARSWSQRQVAHNMRATYSRMHGNENRELPGIESQIRKIKGWEAGDHYPDEESRTLLAATFGTVTNALFPPDSRPGDDLLVMTGMDTLELVSRLRASSVDNSTLDAMRITADRLCSDYPHLPASALRVEGQQWLKRVMALLDERLTLAQHREVLSLAGLIALLVGCVEYDMGDRAAAEVSRRSALTLGAEADDRSVQGWAHEMTAWFALTTGDYRRVIAASEAGLSVAGDRVVSVQLAAQTAKAWARLGNRRQVEVALDKGRHLLETMPYPENTDHHFVVDPAKWDFYSMDAYRLLGENALAENYAEEVLRLGSTFDGPERSPMRNAEARVTLGVVAAREGDVERAVSYGRSALDGDRQSLPSLIMCSRELGELLSARFADVPVAAEYLEDLRSLTAASTASSL